ncbi:MAG: glycosyltransferase family 39 protein [Bacteroidota bacterium]
MQEELELQQRYVIFALLLILTGLFLNMGIHPLYHEEPRRAMIAWEMLQHHQWFTPTVTGEFYYKKPAAYSWLIALSYSLFGVNEFSTRLFSQLAFIGIAYLGFIAGRKYVNTNFGIWNALLVLSCVDVIFYFSVTGGEIDLVFSFLIVLMVYILFHFYEKKQYLAMFSLSYAIAAIATLTKALPAIAFIGFSVLVLLYYHKDFKRIFSGAHLAGILIYFLITFNMNVEIC